ncbi:MAG: type II toxin-antitoxin system RelE/ParE family toxin [Candidatus Parabeggiatoa sp. nov. 1]|nr:MAG: type II toxin-antitoxin system RelE/ParE family toxin [Gammaproteobacteria bacterium]
MNWRIIYYSEGVSQIIEEMPVGIRAVYARITAMMMEFGPRSLGNGLFEIRAKSQEGIARVFYCTLKEKKIVILHGFVKKSQKTPLKELAIAHKRSQEVQNENA